MTEKRPVSSGLAKFFALTVAAALVTTAVTNVYENRNAASEARQAMVRELSETVASVTTSRSITVAGNAPGAYLNRRCEDLQARLPDSAALKEACDKAVVDELLQEQELGNQERRDLARLGVLAEVAEGQFGAEPATEIRRLETASRLMTRLTNANQPRARRDYIHDLASQADIEIPASDAEVLATSVTPDGDVIATAKFQEAFDAAGEEVAALVSDVTQEIRDADVEGRDTSFMSAALRAALDPFVVGALLLALLFYALSKRQPRPSRSSATAELSE